MNSEKFYKREGRIPTSLPPAINPGRRRKCGLVEKGQIAVKESFERGISNGPHPLVRGWRKRSVEPIVQGQFSGLYEAWYPDGTKIDGDRVS